MRLLLFLMFIFSSLFAQSYEEYLRAQEQAFSSFKEARDKEFSEFLNKEWKAYKEAQGERAYDEKKPEVLPKAPKKKILSQKKKEVIKKQIIAPLPPKKKEQVYKKIVILPPSENIKTLYTKFFGVDLQIHHDKSMAISMKKNISKDKIASAWDSLAGSEYETTIRELKIISKTLRLNGWADYLLVKQVASAIYSNTNEANIFSWFALLKMGYDAHISYQSHKVILLLPIEGNLYNTIYYTLKGKKYYAVDYYAKGKIGSIMTYDNGYKGANASLDFSITHLPLFAESKEDKRLIFRINEKNKAIVLSYNTNMLRFFQSYPQVSYENYFSSAESILLSNSIKKSFAPLLKDKGQNEALDVILNFVQNAFAYQVDDQQFSMEKVMFPSETIFYPYSDCEDRAILFTYMVKTLLNMEIVGVKYPNHMATAVRIDEDLEGDYIKAENVKYIIADPTYINAGIGMSMPQFKGSTSYSIVSTGGEK